MNGWLALSLSLMLGQTPSPSPSAGASPTAESAAPQQGQARTPEEVEAELALRKAEVEELRAQTELLQAQQEAQRQEHQARIESLEQQEALKNTRAQELEQLRQQQLASMSRGYDWLITAADQLEAGEFSIGPAITSAQQELSNALSTSVGIGRGESARLMQSAMARISTVEGLVADRNFFLARRQVQDAGFELHLAWQLTLNRSGTTLVNQ
ncbi:hypothetical protein [Vitiosangium sp. GDMCC 1.1324]|uniref:hypothetical protein n=1 Tax=Vitiosangium sp. (strain GDMCC 1.1324) TaxID=2138576 RepID=UPI000D33FB12|nr:hypothetical protein [Vitiosangium sp. GDMCC 1.1324]PTL80531.1 hypothetical protein DAT35_28265 [Vitiosangium sp. GDMCC 1.1324]